MPSITISDRAAERGKALVEAQDVAQETPGLRVRIVGGGCSGLSYQMSIVDGPEEGDEIFEHEGFRVFVDKKSLFFLNGSQLEYHDALTGAGFKFHNPNVTGTCGCGESFNV